MTTTTNAAVREVMNEFRTTYADAVIADMTDSQFWEATRTRRLMWQSTQRLSLADAVRCYGQLAGPYNRFRPNMLRKLLTAFRDDGIQVTPAREYSVAVYLHVPDVAGLRSRVESFVRRRFQADAISWQEDGTLRCWWD
jgi:hypothetical protein